MLDVGFCGDSILASMLWRFKLVVIRWWIELGAHKGGSTSLYMSWRSVLGPDTMISNLDLDIMATQGAKEVDSHGVPLRPIFVAYRARAGHRQ